MAWGLGFIEDLVGKGNIDAARHAYNNSRFKETVDDVSKGLGSLATTAENKYNQFHNTAEANRIAREQERYAADKARQLQPPKDYAEFAARDKGLEDASADFLGLGAGKALNSAKAMYNGGTPAIKVAEDIALAAKNRVTRNKYLKDKDIVEFQQYKQDLVRDQFQRDDIARQMTIDKGITAARAKQELARRKGQDYYGTLY